MTKIKAFSRRSRAATANNCTKKRDARVKLLFWLLNLLFLPFSLPSRSSDLKVPITAAWHRKLGGNTRK